MMIGLGIVMMIASGCSLFLLHSVIRHMPTRWLKLAVSGMLLTAALSLGLRGAHMAISLDPLEPLMLALATTYSISVIILFLCATGKLNGHN